MDAYTQASGQVINFDKYALCFSKHILPRDKNEMANMLVVQVVKCHTKYLSLPSFLGFGGGVRIPIIRFTRALGESFVEVKVKAGKGFVIYRQPLLLLVLGFGGVLLWPGVVTEGSRWRVGDSTNICIFDDKWLPHPSTFKVISPPSLKGHVLVSQLIAASGGWNHQLIRESFLPMDADLILSLPLNSSGVCHLIVWHFDKFGYYSVRSGYWVGMNLISLHPSSSGLESSES
ncbi:hypothetical protein Dsin_017581 [Dipteronia sinensis]|uniref:Uncharacterized protein n=1 Tax=Dipteronia sinensis TaxID=43782 RepID=A0AAE0AGN7_9ROSI|nr:hypothetical protein Dsin_017581 [Dipteronia sinensis]